MTEGNKHTHGTLSSKTQLKLKSSYLVLNEEKKQGDTKEKLTESLRRVGRFCI